MDNVSLALQLFIIASQSAAKWADLITSAQRESRDITDEEMNAASEDYKSAHAQLDALLKG